MIEGIRGPVTVTNLSLVERVKLHFKGYPWILKEKEGLDDEDRISAALNQARTGKTGYIRSAPSVLRPLVEQVGLVSVVQNELGLQLQQVPGVHCVAGVDHLFGVDLSSNRMPTRLENYLRILETGFQGNARPNIFLRRPEVLSDLSLLPKEYMDSSDNYVLFLWTGFSTGVHPKLSLYFDTNIGTVGFVKSTPPRKIESVIILEDKLSPGGIDEKVAFYLEQLESVKPHNSVRIETSNHEEVSTLRFY